MEIRYASNPSDVKTFDTERLREEFLAENIMKDGEISFVYSHYDRFIVGGAVPVAQALTLGTYESLKSDYFLERREIGIINVGGAGTVTVDGEKFILENRECVFAGMGKKEVVFESNDSANPAHYYLASAPAHTAYPTQKYTLEDAEPMTVGSKDNSNERTIYKFIHAKGIQSCQLVMGMTMFSEGCVWNTMPCHVHDRRMEAYFYFDFSENDRVMHFMGEPQELRPLVVAPEQAIISPPWSVHFGAGTSSYAFIWGMAGENKDYTDMDQVAIKDLK